LSLTSELATVLAQYQVNPSRLVIEVTEGLMIADRDAASRALNSIKALGARIALDDFGTGYSSLSTLHQLPVDILKIAKPFIDDIDTPGGRTAFVESIIRMGEALGLATVAEGIERPAQAEMLSRLGCSMGQGFLFGRALPPEQLIELLRGWHGISELVALTAPSLRAD
jgi:EAL domain-containing protein (putative c-di-GMP-specific phosphodiesterase class I)